MPDTRPNVFASEYGNIFTTYEVEIAIRDRIMAGTPKNPKLMQGWLRAKSGVSDEEEVRRMMVRTLQELGVDVAEDTAYDDLVKASESYAAGQTGNGFKRCASGLYIEGRHMKACMREAVAIVFAGEKRGPTRKGAKNFWVERVFVDPDIISLGTDKPSGTQLFIGHTSGPQGPQSNLTLYDFVDAPTLAFTVIAMNGAIEDKEWAPVWVTAGEIGLGSLRSQGYGRFDVVRWDKVETNHARLAESRRKAREYRTAEDVDTMDADFAAAVAAARSSFESNGVSKETVLTPVG